ncbi:MAG: uroporphyrinogen decarboxylase [Gammaproteobacteria bacterium]|jgi:uroporphyrinogen decarboxylase|nr:uroporphyrinogen decarboxylase [Gammaproteobacteria bacterium]MBK8993670.1 uroporphyrinogen decarboxylase [Gammaproteobacteria bacterium]MBK9469872.1 uroporphyrinogen decarboxylase [Gammaproteobacteria bacterium]MBP6482828.1 uroporphyrinogen decarboxylase [Pseudomonadales bacterium]MBP7911600.1 uroporphyrinogen decarboxylase [Pseudomonadales bacterium]
MAQLKNDRLLRALRREPVDRTPVWIMRQAGRYLPEYRATRARAGGIMELFRSPELACEVTLQPLDRYDLDAAILFSDILTVPDALGLGLYFEAGEGPRFRNPVRSAADIAALPELDPERDLGYVMDAVRTIVKALDGRVPLIGFSGSPWTLATYMVEGGSTRDFARIKTLAFTDPARMHQLLALLADAVTRYLDAQIRAGAQAVQVFDTWGGVLGHAAYREFSLQYMARIVAGLRAGAGRDIPVILFTKGGGLWIEDIAATGCDCIGLDWTADLGAARRHTGARVALQGNMDPAILRAPPERIRAEVAALLDSFGPGSGHVFNLGHGITPEIDPENVRALVEAVRELSPAYHR